MRLGPVVHGGLLVAALAFSYQTSTRTQSQLVKHGTHRVWKLESLSAVVYESDTKRVRIEARSDENGPYYWGEVKRTTVVNPPVTESVDSNGGDAGPSTETSQPKVEVSIREFPVGTAGEELMEEYQSLMALRELGPLEPEELEHYNLHEKTINLTAIEKGMGEHSLLLSGEKIYGGTDRYMLDVDKSIGYVLSGKLIQPLESAESSLSLKNVHSYDEKSVKSIAITTTAGDKVLVKRVDVDESGERVVWAYEDSPESSDVALGGFVDRVSKLKPTRYQPELDSSSLVHIATLRYRDDDKESLGYLELYRQLAEAQEAPKTPGATRQTQYYIKTERTRVLGRVGRLGADRVDQDLVELFGIKPAPKATKAPAPATKAPAPATKEPSSSTATPPSPAGNPAPAANPAPVANPPSPASNPAPTAAPAPAAVPAPASH